MKKSDVEPGAEYLNVDFEIRSRSDLTPLANELSRSLDLLYCGRIRRTFLASFEAPGSGLETSPDRAIKRLAAAVSTLSPSARSAWKDARDRVFDIGVAANSTGRDVLVLALLPETLRTIAKLDARLAVTFYPPEGRMRPSPGSYTVEVGTKTARRSPPKRSVRAKVPHKRNLK